MKLTGAQIIIECLLEQGVDTIFGYPGGSVLNIYDALYEYSDKINHIITAHEQGAAHAADGYARASGKTGVCLATSGPGATNLVTGIATAYMDSIPMVAITGNVPVNLLGLDSFQEVDITGITMPITKHNFIVKDINNLADTIRKAFYIANEGRKGPVLVDIPKDITIKTCDYQKVVPTTPAPVISFTQSDIEKAVNMIEKSQKPFVYTGGGVISSEASQEVRRFVELIDAPVSSSLMGQGSFDNTDKRYIGMLGMHGTLTASYAITECDLFVGIGTRFSDRVICDIKSFAPNAKIIHIDIDPAEVDKNIKVNHNIIGNVKDVLVELNKKISQKDNSEWINKILNWKKEFPLVQSVDNDPDALTPQYVFEILNKLNDGNIVMATEVGQNQMWAAQFFDNISPRTFISSGGLGTMGYGLGAAIGAQVACPEKRVVNAAGDGSFHMNCNELVTASKFNIPVIELLFNNDVLGMVRQWQRLFYGKRFSQTTLERPTDYIKLAEAFGVKAFRITEKNQVEDVLKQALSIKAPVVIECVIDKDINVLPMVPAGGAINQPITKIDLGE